MPAKLDQQLQNHHLLPGAHSADLGRLPPQAEQRSCTSCHDKADNSPGDKCPGGGGPGGDLVLSGDPDPWNLLEVASYVQLFEPDYYQKNENGDWVLVTDPLTQCPNGIEGELSVKQQDGICITRRLMSARGYSQRTLFQAV